MRGDSTRSRNSSDATASRREFTPMPAPQLPTAGSAALGRRLCIGSRVLSFCCIDLRGR